MLVINSEQNDKIVDQITSDFYTENILRVEEVEDVDRDLIAYITKLCNGVLFRSKILLEIPFIVITSDDSVASLLDMIFISDVCTEKPDFDYFIYHKYLPISIRSVGAMIRIVNEINGSSNSSLLLHVTPNEPSNDPNETSSNQETNETDLQTLKVFEFLGYVERAQLSNYFDENWHPDIEDIEFWMPTAKLVNSVHSEYPMLSNGLKILLNDIRPYVQVRNYKENMKTIQDSLIKAMDIIDFHVREFIELTDEERSLLEEVESLDDEGLQTKTHEDVGDPVGDQFREIIGQKESDDE